VPADGATPGAVQAGGDLVMAGYRNDPEATAATFTTLGLRTGDLAVVDEDGFVYVVDRRDDFIKSWGYRISSQEVEACALHVPELLAAAAVGVPDDDAGEAVTLFVSLRPGVDANNVDVLGHCRRHLAKHMVPRRLVVVDGLPLNANGKVDKRRLRELAAVPAAPVGAG
jgi:acyl-CoA synthetase (AMP-forming)/AMP-acid ligase II